MIIESKECGRNNKIGDKGMISFADGLKSMTALRSLELDIW